MTTTALIICHKYVKSDISVYRPSVFSLRTFNSDKGLMIMIVYIAYN